MTEPERQLQRRRPGPLRWLGYAVGLGLPPAQRSWVLYDVTTRSWVWRHAARTVVQLVPVAVLLYLLIPGASWVRVLAVVSGVLIGLFYSFCYLGETAEHRAVKAGYPPGTATAARAERHVGEHPGRDRRYNERWRGGPPG